MYLLTPISFPFCRNVYDIREMDRIIIWAWTKKSSKIPMKITRRKGWENPVGCPAGRRHAANESN
jgi:hypothetical protein